MDSLEYSGERPWRRNRLVSRPVPPAVGVDIACTVPAAHVWRLVAVSATLTTSAVVANRAVSLVIGDGVGQAIRVPSAAVQAASLTVSYNWFAEAANVAVGAVQAAAMPEIDLMPGWTLGTLTGLIDTGDQWSAVSVTVVDTMVEGGAVNLDELPEMLIQLV